MNDSISGPELLFYAHSVLTHISEEGRLNELFKAGKMRGVNEND